MMRDGFSRYAPVVADVFLDHFLARDWERFNTQPLKEYVQWAQGLLASRIEGCPERSRRYFHYLNKTNTLVQYQSIEGICSTLLQMSKRTRFKSGMENAEPVLTNCYNELEENFEIFFPEVVKFASTSIADLTLPIQKSTELNHPSHANYRHVYK
jgi:acyl carrier protein phosphodiesterase